MRMSCVWAAVVLMLLQLQLVTPDPDSGTVIPAESRPCVDCHAFEFMQRALQDLKKTAFNLDSRMWTSASDAFERKDANRREQVVIRDFSRADNAETRRIFTEGIMERIPNTAFRGLRHQPHTQLIYALITVLCYVMTKSIMLTCCTPFILMGARYYYSRKVILSYLDCALHTDMADIEAYYMKPT
ncbi:N-acetylaspartate synthetase, partial [Clarias magur]